ncbi:hypothetical protein CHU92_01220 [Flavobacterium cyanobacteriorum]|uniref:Uncharacterized protein n=1 Tax=Flavobacterium cyanobacteriorum TaxID=2022802 RepID=A0A255ZZS7_9FLAO|nr:DUF6526 family protein [Flavobacterium cyanobacteriorum]OYQ46922.1 hypothetical protein CHU92_01220 [Flavobacterium cyanobacteriorum]
MNRPQNYNNHIRFYAPHHFVFYPVMTGLMIFAGWEAATGDAALLWGFLAVIIATITWLSFMLRQHYALTLQNRIILGELRYRYFMIVGQRLEPLEEKLGEGQLFALRFAPDEELAELVHRAVSENLSPKAIKRSIRHWKADHKRV